MNYLKDLEQLIKSNCSLIYAVTSEEERLEHLLRQVIAYDVSQSIQIWNFVDGYETFLDRPNIASRNPLEALNVIESYNPSSDVIFLLRDFHVFLDDNMIIRKLRNLSRKLACINKTILISAPHMRLPSLLNDMTTIFMLPLPNQYEIRLEVMRLLRLIEQRNDYVGIDQLVSLSRGLSIAQIRMIFAKLLVIQPSLDHSTQKFFMLEKQKCLSCNNFLELCIDDISLENIGGIDILKQWLITRSHSFSKVSLNYGLPYPKGILLAGIQGTGKSMTARSIAAIFHLPLFKLDMGKLFGGIVGESENNIREVIKIAESSAPCILWIDEIDKVFHDQIGVHDSGVTTRVLATLLTWLSDKNSPVFVVATANNITHLPSEVIRKGRFDEIFFIDLPCLSERNSIFQVHLKKLRPKTWHRYNTKYLAKHSYLFSGAEIKQVIIEAMHIAFSQNRDFSSSDILKAIDNMVPLAFTNQESIDFLQRWASLGKARLAS